jgi:hypothetical protein
VSVVKSSAAATAIFTFDMFLVISINESSDFSMWIFSFKMGGKYIQTGLG